MKLYFFQTVLHFGVTRRAFSLVELSIVLVILGLLVGGVLSGQSLIRAAELRKVASGIAKYQTAMASFKDKYFALPGDMPNATSFWGALDGGAGVGSSCFTIESTDTKTCNGDGNGFIGETAGSSQSDIWFWGERLHVWNHLANAGLIEGAYTGKTDSASNSFILTPGKNSPLAGGTTGFYDIYSQNFVADSSNPIYFPGFNLKQPLLAIRGGGITPVDAWNIDTKYDDGKPAGGKIWVAKHSSLPCADTDDPATAKYDFTQTGPVCGPIVIMQ